MTPFEAASDLADQGIPTFPCASDKTPMCTGWREAATVCPDPKAWARAQLVAMPTGKASGFDVVDIDPRHGGLAWLEESADWLPPAFAVKTFSGGLHLYFKHRPGMRCSVSKIAPGVDVRAEGGYVIRWDYAGFPSGSFDRNAPGFVQC